MRRIVKTVTENRKMASYRLRMEPSRNETLSCESLLYPTADIAVRRTDFLRIWAVATLVDNCTWPDLNTVGNCSSLRLELLIVDGDNTNVTVCNSFGFFDFQLY